MFDGAAERQCGECGGKKEEKADFALSGCMYKKGSYGTDPGYGAGLFAACAVCC